MMLISRLLDAIQIARKWVGKNKFHKSHHFELHNDVPSYVGEAKHGIGGEPRPSQVMPALYTDFPRGRGISMPSWIAFDRQVLTFDAYYQEGVQEKREEQFRVHECKICFHLEDDTIEGVELKKKNSGLAEGTIIRRHRIPKPAPHDKEYYTLEDFNVGQTVCLYSKVFKISNCDQFTYNFLYKIGVRIPQPSLIPADPHAAHRKAVEDEKLPFRPYEKFDTLKQFLDHDRHVLRFFGVWNDANNMFGDIHQCIMYYYLVDDTVEIREVILPNSGRDSNSVLVKRGKLPKGDKVLTFPGQTTDRTVLNVFGSIYSGERYILDSLKTGALHTHYYMPGDFRIGDVVNVYGRPLLLCDCDEFTRNFYRTKYGIVDFTPIEQQKETSGVVEPQYPPYNGFGSEEDSLNSCKSIVIKPAVIDFTKFMKNDKAGLDSKVLRFLARLDSDKPTDANRRFVINYFLSDDTIEVYELKYSNSAVTMVGDTKDEMILEKNIEFSQSDVKTILEKVRLSEKVGEEQLTKQLLFRDPESSDHVTFQDLAEILREHLPSITEHELLVVGRHYASKKSSSEKGVDAVVAMVQEQLRKAGYEDYCNLLKTFEYEDRNRFHKDKEDAVCYKELVFLIDWCRNPQPLMLTELVDPDLCKGLAEMVVLECVNYRELLKDMYSKGNSCPPPLKD